MEMWGEIGTAAGKIYSGFVGAAPATIQLVKRKTGLDDDMMYLAIGWLAREGKAQITSEKGALRIKINE